MLTPDWIKHVSPICHSFCTRLFNSNSISLLGLSISSNKVWGTNVLENATGKNSTYEGSGQKRFIGFTKLALNILPRV
ncbi:hypothetical protein VCRA2120O9_130124 [Vibrio crassostreae]|nr:hypothetical protein VCRA2120O9_130124 [Vibrio crassostreae]